MTTTDAVFGETEPRGSAQCPTCGRFAPIVGVGADGAPMSAEEGTYYVIVKCPTHGELIS